MTRDNGRPVPLHVGHGLVARHQAARKAGSTLTYVAWLEVEVERLREALRLLDEFDRYASTTEYAGTPFEAEVVAYLKDTGYAR